MIQLKCADLLFLIGAVMFGVASNNVDYSCANNKAFLVNRDDDISGSHERQSVDDRFMFTTMSLPQDSKLLPTLGNGHLGFTVLSDAVYMNGLYNGHAALSHRARFPNFSNILLADCLQQICNYTLNVELGIFTVEFVVENQFIARHSIYAHSFYNRAVINQIHILRLGSRDDINLKLQRNPGNDEALRMRPGNDDDKSNNFHNKEPKNFQSTPNTGEKDDLKFTKNETIVFDGARLYLLCGHIRERENEEKRWREEATEEEPSARQEEDVCVLWNHVPERITLKQTASSISYKFVMAVDKEAADVRQEMIDVLRIADDELFASHIKAWKTFWSDFQISVDGDDELFRAVISSVFYLKSSLPTLKSNLPQHPFYGLSPTGLGRGGSDLNDYERLPKFWKLRYVSPYPVSTRVDTYLDMILDTYQDTYPVCMGYVSCRTLVETFQGHNFWDTEIFMLPSVAQINPIYAQKLLRYRFMMLDAARDYANASGYRGSRFPWESAATGIEVIQPGYEYIAKYQQHISGDISFGLRHYLALTHDVDYMKSEGCELAAAIAEFWASRVSFNESTGFYDIDHVMGPDEDHDNVNNNVYTNIIAKLALHFGSFSRCLCGKNYSNDDWNEIAEKIKVLYDPKLDYHPQFEGFQVGTEIKQADTVLIGFPLMFPMNQTTRLNDLKIYGNATRSSGPAMSCSMMAINYLDVDDEKKANEMLRQSYKPYVRQPFNVWNEVVEGEIGATNFITGAGGFLQTIINGFLGIRVHLEGLEIKNFKLPEDCRAMKISGFSFLNSKFELEINNHGKFLKFIDLKDELVMKVDDGDMKLLEENTFYNISSSKTVNISTTKNSFGNCKLIY